MSIVGPCRFSDALGEPGRGVHALRLPMPFGWPSLALADLVGTVLLALLLDAWLSPGVPAVLVFFALWGVGILLHGVFCVDTPISAWLFPGRIDAEKIGRDE